MKRRIDWRALRAATLTIALLGVQNVAHASKLDGRWVFLQRTVTVADAPVIGKIYATTTAISVHDLVEAGGHLHGNGTLCSLTLDSGTSFVRTILPPALRNVLPKPKINAKLTYEDGKLLYADAPPPVVLGAKVASIGEALPTQSSDARVVDSDGDGHPGVTVRVEGIVSGEIYVVQRNVAVFDGALRVDGSFAGSIRHGMSQVVLGATSSRLVDGPKSYPVDKGSFFRLAPLPKAATCDDAAKLAKGWIP